MQLCAPLAPVNIDALLDQLAMMLRADLDGMTSRLRKNPDTEFYIVTPYGRHSVTYLVDQYDGSEQVMIGFVVSNPHVCAVVGDDTYAWLNGFRIMLDDAAV